LRQKVFHRPTLVRELRSDLEELVPTQQTEKAWRCLLDVPDGDSPRLSQYAVAFKLIGKAGMKRQRPTLVFEEKYEEARMLAHSIKGAGGNIGAERLQNAAAALEERLKAGGTGLPKPEYEAFSKELNRVLTALSSLGEEETPIQATKDEPDQLAPELAKEIAERLRNAVELGDVSGMGEIASDLISRNDATSYYGEEIKRLAEAFDFDGASELAKSLDK